MIPTGPIAKEIVGDLFSFTVGKTYRVVDTCGMISDLYKLLNSCHEIEVCQYKSQPTSKRRLLFKRLKSDNRPDFCIANLEVIQISDYEFRVQLRAERYAFYPTAFDRLFKWKVK